MQSGRFTIVSNWWDHRGEKMIALNEYNKTGVVAVIKRLNLVGLT